MSEPTIYSAFLQELPKLENQYSSDTFLKDYLRTYLPADVRQAIEPDLIHLGQRAVTDLPEFARDAELNEPQLVQFNACGKRVDEIKIAEGWKLLEKASAEEGLVATGYERTYGEHSRLYQFTKLYLFTPSSAIYTCPLAMSDGAARLIELYGDSYLKKEVLPGLLSRDPKTFKTSGQWMTERTGGSDISRSMTFAAPEGNAYLLRGHKWFTSAITADMAFTLASTEPASENKRAPLSLFYLPIRNEDGQLNGIEVEALKNKLGTRALPTAQLLLTGAKARMVGEKGKGVRTIATLFNVTRIYNTISAVSYLRRSYALSQAYSMMREAFGQKIEKHPLHQKSLREMEIASQSNTMLALFLSRLLGREDCGVATENEKALLRLLTPVAKLYTAKQSIKYASELIEMYGGIGYLEDSGIPSILRDTQVLSIWEGTTNVLSLDMLRAMDREHGLPAFISFAETLLKSLPDSKQKENIQQKINTILSFIQSTQSNGTIVACARDIAFYLAEATIALLWLDFLKTNSNRADYTQTLNYWLRYTMQEDSLQAAAALGIA